MNSTLTMQHFELETNAQAHVPRHLRTHLSGVVERAISRSHRLTSFTGIEGAPFEIYAHLQHLDAGFAVFTMVPAERMRKVQPGRILLHGAVAVELATAPLAWRLVFGPMFRYLAASPSCLSWHAPGAMPQKLPWLVTFATHRVHALNDEEREQAREIARLAGVQMVEACLAGVAASRRAGMTFTPDYEQFPELIAEEF
jgi:hypothetical protein